MSQLKTTLLEEKDYGRYEELVRRSPHGSLWATPSFHAYRSVPCIVLGMFKGSELVGGACVPVSGKSVARYVGYHPWHGLVGRSESEGENQAIARGVAEYLLSRYDEVTLTLSPEWTDIREFLWAGMRPHVRYTYRGTERRLEKRVKLHDCFVSCERQSQGWWELIHYRTGDTDITALKDWACIYYWKANKGGQYHSDCLDVMIHEAVLYGLMFDMVGCNSPQRSLFKRSFGGTLTPYYAVTTAECKDLRESSTPESVSVAL